MAVADEADKVVIEEAFVELIVEARLEAAREFFEIRPHQDTIVFRLS